MIEPTIGRVVWFYSDVKERLADWTQPWPALITYVHGPRMVNIGGFNVNGEPFAHTSVELLQDDDVPTGMHCTWMPYQKGQAAKTEALEEKLKAADPQAEPRQ